MLPHEVQQFSPFTGNATDPNFHADTIHHVEFDFYGQKAVTASSDKMVCIWEKDTHGYWRKTASWKKHGGAVWKARFAHPEYGQLIATCSFDNTIQVFDKDAADIVDSRSVASGPDTANGWVCRVVLRQSTASINDIQFAPHYLGLQLAACTSSGRVIIYEAEDIMALDSWNVLFDDEIAAYRLSSLSWSTNRFDPTYIAITSDDVDAPADEKLHIFRVNVNTGFVRSKLGGVIKQFQFEEQVSMIAFGPSCGLAVHKLAIAVGSKIKVYQLMSSIVCNGEGNLIQTSSTSGNSIVDNGGHGRAQQEQGDFVVKSCEVLEGVSSSQVVRFSWNVLGDVIAAVHADGLTHIWRYTFASRWMPISAIRPPAEQDKGAKDDVYY